MPVYYQKSIDSNNSLSIWEITESLDQLLEMSGLTQDHLNGTGFISTPRKQEWVTTRLLLKQMLRTDEKVHISYDEVGKPHLNGIKKNISISHTKQFVALIIHETKYPGIDIELVSSRIEKISDRFLSKTEKSRIKNEKRLEQLFIIWGAKECAFKIFPEGGISFKEMLEVKKFDYAEKGETFVVLKKNNVTCEYPLWWENLDGLMLVYGFSH